MLEKSIDLLKNHFQIYFVTQKIIYFLVFAVDIGGNEPTMAAKDAKGAL